MLLKVNSIKLDVISTMLFCRTINTEVGPSAREILAVFKSLGDLYYQLQTRSSLMLGVESEIILGMK